MAYGDFLQLKQEAAIRARRDLTFAQDATDVGNAINEAYLTVCDDGTQWAWLEASGSFNTAAATDTYTYSTIATGIGGGVTVTDVLAIRQTSGGPMYGLEWTDFERFRGLNTALTGAPTVWTKTRDNEVVVYPTPTGIAALRTLARREPTALSADGDTPLIPLSWRHRILIPYACYRLLQEESGDAAAEAQTYWAEYVAQLDAFRLAHSSRPEPYPHTGPIPLPTGLVGTAGTFLDVAQRACYAAGLRPWLDYDLARAKEAVNEVYLATCNTGDQWSFLEKEGQFQVTANADVYTYASIATAIGVTGAAIADILGVVNDTDGSWTLTPMDWRELEKISFSTQETGEATGFPEVWAKWGGGDVTMTEARIRFGPKPDSAYKFGVFARLRPVELTADTDVPLIPLDYRREVLVTGAAVRLLDQLRPDMDDPARLASQASHQARYERAVQGMRATYAALREPTATLMGAGYPYGVGDIFDVSWDGGY